LSYSIGATFTDKPSAQGGSPCQRVCYLVLKVHSHIHNVAHEIEMWLADSGCSVNVVDAA